MEKFDIERMHRDCLEWCESPVWKPWQNYELYDKDCRYSIQGQDDELFAGIHYSYGETLPQSICEFAHLIGIDVESYRKEAAEPEKEIETIDAEAHEILIGKGWVWNESLNRWQKGDARIHHNDKGDFYTYKKGDAEKGIASKPWNAILPFGLWADSIELEPENKADQEDPFSELIESLERLKNGILENDRRDKIELLKLAVQMATQYSKKESGMKFGFATETFYKQLCKLVGLDEPQPQTVEQALQNLETLMAEPPDASDIATNALTPKEVLEANGWVKSTADIYRNLMEHPGICVRCTGLGWAIGRNAGSMDAEFWKPKNESTFPQWLAAEVANLQTPKPEQRAAEQGKPEPNAIYNNAAKVENAKEAQMEPINFLKSVLPFGDTIREAPKEYCQKLPIDSVAYFDWRGLIYKFNQETSIIDLAPSVGMLSSNDASILMTALVKLAAKA